MPNAAYGPQPKTENVKLTFTCPVNWKTDPDRYAALRAQAYGEAVDAAKLIPHMLEAFMAGDRQSSTTQCDAAFSPDALMWLLADEAMVLRSGSEKS